MAKTPTPDDDALRKKGKTGSIVIWALMAMLILGLGGFGVTSFGGGRSVLGTVGEREIVVEDYARALQQELAAFSAQVGQNVTLEQAQALGLDRQVRQRLVATAALDNETDRIGISAGDARVAREITGMQAFQGVTGKFDREAYRFTLERNNLTERSYEARVREDLARALLQGAVASGFAAPPALTDTLFAYISEQRSISLLRMAAGDLESLPPAATEADLKAFYDANIDRFTRPEARRITYAAVLPEDMAPKVEVNEDALRETYDARLSEFVQPERRLVERLVFPDEASAKAAKEAIDAGGTFDAAVAARGLTLEDVDLGEVAAADLGDAAEAVFALPGPGVVGPLPSSLGPALFRMNAVLAAQERSFDEVKDDLRPEVALDAAKRAIGEMVEDVDDRLAGGATLEDLAKETDLTLGTVDFTPDLAEGIAGYPEFRAAAGVVAEGDFPEAILLNDGGLIALRLDAIVPPAAIPFDEARPQVEAAQAADALAKALADRAIAIKAGIEGGASLGSFGIVDVTSALTRSTPLEGAPAALNLAAFDMEPGQVRVIEDGEFVAVLQLDAVIPGDPQNANSVALRRAIAVQAEQGLAQDAFQLYTDALTSRAGISFDDAALNAVHSQFP